MEFATKWRAENAIPIPLGRYSDCLNETGGIRYQMALLKMPFRFHSADIATVSNETDEIRYQMAFQVLYNFSCFLSNLFFFKSKTTNSEV
ncbi:MAG: hypothetical protein OXH00_12270 [Candidatus Poribacteria bacterium]|nr:hypothetical protein [Candidatus Poribacteria bacterium]